MTMTIDCRDWEVCAHRHTPMGDTPDLSDSDQWKWQPAAIPFDAISWLFQNGHGPDPVVGFNDLLYRWCEDVDWVLRKKFLHSGDKFLPEDELQVAIDQVDCYFEMYLNGTFVGGGRNQFREHLFDLDATLKPENEILIYVRSARNVNSMLESASGRLPAGYDTGRVHARRCQSLTGWDWTPRLSSVSMMKAPRIRVNAPIQLDNIYAFTTHLPKATPGQVSAENVEVHIIADLVSRRRATGELTITISDTDTGEVVGELREPMTIKPKSTQLRRLINLPKAQLWWSLGMGSQPLYSVEISINAKDRLDQNYNLAADAVFGVRTLTISHQKDEQGESFTPILNGVPIFCRGANWIQNTMLPANVRQDDYKKLLSAVIGAGMNCLRVWGGGIYETDEFYKTCDESGILVWQDFMFACAAYPTYREFLDEVEAEANYQVVRLRNHPCIMLWCGNNENEWLHQTGGLKKGGETKIIGDTIWSHIVRAAVENNDQSRYYHQSSPFGRNRNDYNDQETGDRHSWDVWSDWQNIEIYLRDSGRFISEFGFQALPDLASIKQFSPSADELDSPELCHHQRMIEGQERLARYVAAHYKMPSNLEEWVTTTQQMQSGVLASAVEHWRRRRFSTSGALVWQLHDAYPAISWSMIDYYRRPKMSYKNSRRFFAPALLSMELIIDGKEASSIPPEIWPENLPEATPDFEVAGGDRVVCRAGAPLVQVRFVIINDTNLQLSGPVKVEFLLGNHEPVILDRVQAELEPNTLTTVLTHDIGPLLMQNIKNLKVHAEWLLDENSQAALQKMENHIQTNQHRLIQDSDNIQWQFQATSGLTLSTPLVDAKYLS